MDYLEDFAKEHKAYTWKDILFGIIFFPIILPLFFLKKFYNQLDK